MSGDTNNVCPPAQTFDILLTCLNLLLLGFFWLLKREYLMCPEAVPKICRQQPRYIVYGSINNVCSPQTRHCRGQNLDIMDTEQSWKKASTEAKRPFLPGKKGRAFWVSLGTVNTQNNSQHTNNLPCSSGLICWSCRINPEGSGPKSGTHKSAKT